METTKTYEQTQQERRERAAEIIAAHPALTAFFAGDPQAFVPDRRHFRTPQAENLGYLRARARTGSGRKYGPEAYTPSTTWARLLLGEAVCFGTYQAPYADHAYYVVPVVLTPGAAPDWLACQRNLSAFAASIRTHTGWAGSGTTYSLTLHITDAGAFVVLEARHSISD